MTKTQRSPAQLRSMFGANLRLLASKYPSISELSRQLGINRTQFNRYLGGESFPRPDVLDRICSFFGVDARILLEPVENLSMSQDSLVSDVLSDFVGAGVSTVSESLYPSGFYRFTRQSFVSEDNYVVGLVYVFRKNGNAYVRGYEAKEAMKQQGLPIDAKSREFRGFVTQQEDGISMLISRRNAITTSFNYLSKVASMNNNYWVGYVTRTVPESLTGTRAVRMVYEYLSTDLTAALGAARTSGLCKVDDLLPFHRRLLQPGHPFR